VCAIADRALARERWDIVSVIAFLAPEDAAYINRESLYANGGISMAEDRNEVARLAGRRH
jgi:hypothetical protein